MAAKPKCTTTGEPDQAFARLAAGTKLKFTVGVRGAKGIATVSAGRNDRILQLPKDPEKAGRKTYTATWMVPSGVSFKNVTAKFGFPLAVSYDYKIEVVGEGKVLKDIRIKCPREELGKSSLSIRAI